MHVDDPFYPATEAGIHRLEVSTPFSVGTVNAYLIEDDPLTLIDSGPNSASSLEELKVQLGKLGYRIEDLQLLIITHQHIDHFGLTGIIARQSNATVLALSSLSTYLGDYQKFAERDDSYAEQLMRYHGVPDDVIYALRAVAHAFRAWGDHVNVTKPISTLTEIPLSHRALTAYHRPGHSPTDTVYYDDKRKIAFGGDHLLAHISSNPLIALPMDEGEKVYSPADRPKALPTYINSLKQTQKMDIDLLLTGHGNPITDHRTVISDRLIHHSRRCEKVLSIISSEPKTVYEIAREIWGNVAVTEAYLTLCEVLGHLDLLLEDGQAEVVPGKPTRFTSV